MRIRPAALLAAAAALALGACSAGLQTPSSPTAPFFTSTLPASGTAPPTHTAPPPTAPPTAVPIEGTTTAQLNVRAQPSTAGQTLGMLAPFSQVQILGKEPGGNWYQILYPAAPDGRGWVTARFVQIPEGQEIPTLGGGNSDPSGPSGVVTQQVNVRSGPGTSFDALGTLNPQDSVTLTGKNPDGTWLQVAYPGAPSGRGWVAAGYIQSSEIPGLPIINEQGVALGTGTPAVELIPTATLLPAFQDADSASSPAASRALAPGESRMFEFTSDISAPEGDTGDWVAFVSYARTVAVRLDCLGSSGIAVEIWEDGAPAAGLPTVHCSQEVILELSPGSTYLAYVHFPEPSPDLQYTRFVLKISIV